MGWLDKPLLHSTDLFDFRGACQWSYEYLISIYLIFHSFAFRTRHTAPDVPVFQLLPRTTV